MVISNSPIPSARIPRGETSVDAGSPRKEPRATSARHNLPAPNGEADTSGSVRLLHGNLSARSQASPRIIASGPLASQAKISHYAIPMSGRSQVSSARNLSSREPNPSIQTGRDTNPPSSRPALADLSATLGSQANESRMSSRSPRPSPMTSRSARPVPAVQSSTPRDSTADAIYSGGQAVEQTSLTSARSVVTDPSRALEDADIVVNSARPVLSSRQAVAESPRPLANETIPIQSARQTAEDQCLQQPVAESSGHLEIAESTPRNHPDITPVEQLSIDDMLVQEGLEEEPIRPEPVEYETEEETPTGERVGQSGISSVYYNNTTLITCIPEEMDITHTEEERNVGAPSPAEPSPTPADGDAVEEIRDEVLGETLNKALIEASSTPVKNDLSRVNLASPSPIPGEINVSKYSTGSAEEMAFIEAKIHEELEIAAPENVTVERKKNKGICTRVFCCGRQE
jgi:hypothetical protein